MKACFRGSARVSAVGPLLFLILAAALLPRPAAAKSSTVASLNDAGPGSLRQALLDANASPEADTITVTATGVLSLQSSLPTVTGQVTLIGPGTNRLVLDGGGARRLLAIAAGARVEIRSLTLARGLATGGAHGGAISNAGILSLRSVIVTNCQAVGALGGALYGAAGSSLLATQVWFIANAVRGGDGQDRGPGDSGGGGGGGGGLGGAVFNAGQAVFHGCDFFCNSAQGGRGGAGGADGLASEGGRGGGPNEGLGGAADFAGAPAGGPGGGGGGGGGTDFSFVDDGGAGGLGGGGGGAGARRFGGIGGAGGAAGYYGGRGGDACCGKAGGGGGGAGLGGALFASREGTVQFTTCRFSRNLAWPGAGGSGAPGVGNGTDGAGVGGAVFVEEAGDLIPGPGNEFVGNAAATAFSDLTAGWIRVTSLAEAGPGSLREAMAAAAAAVVPTSIFVDATNAVLSLASQLVFPAGETLLTGPGAAHLTLSGSNRVSVLEVGPGAALALRNLTVAQGRSTNVAGAGLRNAGGRVVLEHCVIASNQVYGAAGGGVYNSGSLQARQTRFTHNLARGGNGESRGFGTSGGGGGGGAGLGGGLFSAGTLHLANCLILSNTAAGGHGGIGGESGFDYKGGGGGGPEGGLAGSGFRVVGGPGGFGGGGGGGGGGEDPEIEPGAEGGSGGLGGGGGGGGASGTDPLGTGGRGGNGGLGILAGRGGPGTNSFAGGGGGGAGLGGGLFVRDGSALLEDCSLSGNRATNGLGGAGGAGVFNGAPGEAGRGIGGGLFDLAGGVSLVNCAVEGNSASSSNANSFAGLSYSLALEQSEHYIVNPGPGTNILLTAQPAGLGPFRYEWFFLGQRVGTAQTLVISNFSLALAGYYQVVITTPAGTFLTALASVGARATPVPDTLAPSFVITAPAAAVTRVTSNAFRFTGTARDPSGIGGVSIREARTGRVQLALGATNWSAFIPLQPGTNVFSVTARDRADNQAAAQFRTLYYAVSNRLKLSVEGSGTVVPNLNNQLLEVGKGYTIKATPGAGQVFRHWLAGTFPAESKVSHSGSFSFLMASNLGLTAVFVPNPFPAVAGAYNGLFAETDEPRLGRSGAVNLTLTSLGAFSGSLRTATQRLAFSGQCNADGFATNVIPRAGTNPLTLELRVLLDRSGLVDGRVTDGRWVAPLRARRAPFQATTNPASRYAGNYTLALAAAGNQVPGVGSVTVSTAGLTKLSGSLFDTPAIAQQVALAGDGSWPLFLPLYGGRGQLLGNVQFGSFPLDSLGGSLAWVKSTLPSSLAAARIAPASFTNSLAALGSRYPTPVTNRVLNFSLGLVELSGGDLGGPFTNAVALSSGNVVTNLSPNPLSMTITKANGLFSGRATEPGTNRTASFKGVVLPQRGVGVGYFPGSNALGQVRFGPQPL